MKSITKYIFVFALIIPTLSFANEIKKESWVSQMNQLLPKHFCMEKQYFRQCFKITEEQCNETAKKVTEDCMKKFDSEMPAVFKQPTDGGKWGGKVGGCAGKNFEVTLLSKRINSDKCNDPKNWIPKK